MLAISGSNVKSPLSERPASRILHRPFNLEQANRINQSMSSPSPDDRVTAMNNNRPAKRNVNGQQTTC